MREGVTLVRRERRRRAGENEPEPEGWVPPSPPPPQPFILASVPTRSALLTQWPHVCFRSPPSACMSPPFLPFQCCFVACLFSLCCAALSPTRARFLPFLINTLLVRLPFLSTPPHPTLGLSVWLSPSHQCRRLKGNRTVIRKEPFASDCDLLPRARPSSPQTILSCLIP